MRQSEKIRQEQQSAFKLDKVEGAGGLRGKSALDRVPLLSVDIVSGNFDIDQ